MRVQGANGNVQSDRLFGASMRKVLLSRMARQIRISRKILKIEPFYKDLHFLVFGAANAINPVGNLQFGCDA